MLLAYLGSYTIVLLIIWGFFTIARLHSYKFKNFSNHITHVTNFLLIFLIILSILGYILIFLIDDNNIGVKDIEYGNSYEEVNY